MNGRKTLKQYLRENIQGWIDFSIRICDGKCIITKQPYEIIHHKYPFNRIVIETLNELELECKEYTDEYNNEDIIKIKDKCLELHFKYGAGACLTKELHKEFHSLFSNKYNTICQFEEFVYMKTNSIFNNSNIIQNNDVEFDFNNNKYKFNKNKLIYETSILVIKKYDIKFYKEDFYIKNEENDGYIKTDEIHIKQICLKYLNNDLGTNRILNEIINMLKIKTYTENKSDILNKNVSEEIDFLEMFVNRHITEDIDGKISKVELYQKYLDYCYNNDFSYFDHSNFGKQIKKIISKIQSGQRRKDGKLENIYKGILFKN